MNKIKNLVNDLYRNMGEIWTVEWWLDDQGVRHFHVDTLDDYMRRSYSKYRDGINKKYHLIGFSASIDQAHEYIDLFKENVSPENVIPFPIKS